ncbi:radical SAM/SPASM domain-containing protein [Chlamydiota bacterium]
MSPSTVDFQWHITHFCTMKCVHCYQEEFSPSADLMLHELSEITQKITYFAKSTNRKMRITLTGGEPLLSTEFYPLLSILNKKEVVQEISIISNGVFLATDWLEKLSPINKLTTIKISLDGTTPEINDPIRKDGAYEKVVNNLKMLKSYKSRFSVILMYTLLKRNKDDIGNIVAFCKKHSLDGAILERFIPLGGGKKICDEVLSRKEWNEALKILIGSCGLLPRKKEFESFRAFWISLKNNEITIQGAPCMIQESSYCIMPDGTVYPCRRLPISLGNLLEASGESIFSRSDEKTREIPEKQGCKALGWALDNN